MDFNDHSKLKDLHSFLSPSSPAWLNYNESKFNRVYLNHLAAQKGTRMHAVAHELIDLRVKLPDDGKTLSLYVNDAIAFKMASEQVLFGTPHCFGTADTISYKRETLRIHDLKTGVNEASMTQLEIYAALFCMEYEISPFEIKIELRIYQNDLVKVHVPDPTDIVPIISQILVQSKIIEAIRSEVRL